MRRSIGRALLELREDGGLSRTAVAGAAGIDRSFLGKVERGERSASLAALTAIATVLGADLSLRAYPTTGPRIRDHIQAAMVEALQRILHPRWTASPEVPVYRPSRGVIDLVLSDSCEPLVVASEMHSELRRLEQQMRWHREKEASLPSADLWGFATGDAPAATSRLLVLRSTRSLRELTNTYAATLRAVYPARAADVLEGADDRYTAMAGRRHPVGAGGGLVRRRARRSASRSPARPVDTTAGLAGPRIRPKPTNRPP